MGRVVADLLIKIGADNSGAKKGLAEVDDQIGASVARSKAASVGLIAVGGAIATGIGFAVKAAATFEQGMSGVQAAITGLDSSQMAKLSDEALRIGETTTQSATGAAQAMEILGKAGVSYTEIMDGAAQAAVNLAEATGEQLPQAAESLAGMINLWEGMDPGRAADIFTQGMNQSSATMSEFQTGIIRMSPLIAATGMSFEDAAAQIAFFNQMGVPAAEVGTSMTRIFTDVTQPIGAAADGLAALGIEAYDLNGNFVGMPSIFDQVIKSTAGMTAEQRDLALGLAFSDDAMDLLNLAIKNGTGNYDEIRASMDETGVAAEASAIRLDNLAGDIEGLRGVVESAAIAVGNTFLLPLRLIVKGISTVVAAFNKLPKSVKQIIAIAAGAGAALLLLAGALGLVASSGATFGAGFALIGAAVGLVLSPVMLLIAALGVLAFAFSGPLGAGIEEIGDRLGEFMDDIGDVYDRLREGTLVYDEFNDAWVRLDDGASVANAAIRAFGSALEDLVGIEMSDFFFNLAEAVDAALASFQNFMDLGLNPISAAIGAFGSALSSLSGGEGPLFDIGEGLQQLVMAIDDFITAAADLDIQGMLDAAFDIGEITIDIALAVGELTWGGIKSGIGNLTDWVKGKILGEGALTGNDATGSPTGPGFTTIEDISLGDVGLYVLNLAWRGIKAGIGSISTWVKSRIIGQASLSGNDGTGSATGPGFTTIEDISLGDVAVYVANLAWGGIKSGFTNVVDFVREQLGIGDDGFGGSRGGEVYGTGMEYTTPPIVVNVLEWAKGTISDVWDDIEGWVTAEDVEPITVSPTANVGPPAEVNDSEWWDAIDTRMENEIGLDIDIQDWNARLVPLAGNLQIIDAVTGMDNFLEETIGIDIDIQDWKAELTGSGIVGAAPGVIQHIDDSLELMIGGIDIELQNPIKDIAGTVGGWLEPAVTTLQDWAGNIRGAWASVADAIRGPVDVIGASGFGGSRGSEVFGESIVIPWELDPAQPIDGMLNEAMAGVEVVVPVAFEVSSESTWDPRNPDWVMGHPVGNTGPNPGLGLMFQVDADTTPAETTIAEFTSQLATGATHRITFDADTGPAAIAYTDVMTWGGIWASTPFVGQFLGDTGGAAVAYTDVMTWGGIWGSSVHTGTFAGNTGPAAIAYTDVMTWGGIWAGSVFTSMLAADPGAAAAAFDYAYGLGYGWAGSVFTAYISVDTSGLDNAVFKAQWAASQIAAVLPHSPAKKGPLSVLPSFAYIGEIAARDLAGVGDLIAAAINPGDPAIPRFGARVPGRSRFGATGDGELPVRGGGVTQYNTYRIDRASFADGTDWDRFFAGKAREAAIASYEG